MSPIFSTHQLPDDRLHEIGICLVDRGERDCAAIRPALPQSVHDIVGTAAFNDDGKVEQKRPLAWPVTGHQGASGSA
jgi:hypothetical protein